MTIKIIGKNISGFYLVCNSDVRGSSYFQVSLELADVLTPPDRAFHCRTSSTICNEQVSCQRSEQYHYSVEWIMTKTNQVHYPVIVIYIEYHDGFGILFRVTVSVLFL